MTPMQYNNYVTLHCIWAHMHCIGAVSADSIISVTLNFVNVINLYMKDV